MISEDTMVKQFKELEMKKGSKVKLVNMSHVVAAFGSNDIPGAYLTKGDIYTVLKVEDHKWHTTVKLVEMQCKRFNSHHFEIIKD